MSERVGSPVHPCLKCGACCAAFRVSFYWAEATDGGGRVPVDMTTRVSFHLRAMAGTAAEPLRCHGLEGDIGTSVRCTLYDDRPSPCREFEPSYERGERNVRCDQARLRYGLRPLSPDDWREGEDVPTRPRPVRPAAG